MTLLRRTWLIGLILVISTTAMADDGGISLADRRSGLKFVSPQTRNLQADDFSNPGMLWVLDGESLWQKPSGVSGTACADCHGDAMQSMRGVAARYPVFDSTGGRPIDLQGRINQCRTERQEAPAFDFESQPLLTLTAYVAHQSRGDPVVPEQDKRLVSFIKNGERYFHRRIGQLDLSCAICHDDLWGQRLSGSLIPQAHPTAYPIYRLEWQTVGSLQRRIRDCMISVRAEPFAYGSPEMVDLELYLMVRAAGLPIETPGVRP